MQQANKQLITAARGGKSRRRPQGYSHHLSPRVLLPLSSTPSIFYARLPSFLRLMLLVYFL